MAFDYLLFFNFLLAAGLGALIGLEREYTSQHEKKEGYAGIRTFIIITLLGAIVAYVSANVFMSHWFTIVGFAGMILLAIFTYVSKTRLFHAIGATTALAMVFAYVMGVLVALDLRLMAIVFTVLVTASLALKGPLHGLAKKLVRKELYATLQFAVVSLVVLPFLPNVNYTPMDIPYLSTVIENVSWLSVDVASQLDVLNPYKIWLMVVFISGISYVGYILISYVGAKKGLGLTGFIGGLVSSTAVTSSLSIQSKKYAKLALLFAMGVLVACSVMFFRILLEVLVVNFSLLKYLVLPMLLMGLTLIISSVFAWKMSRGKKKQKFNFNSPFALWPAVKFGAFFALVLFVSKLAYLLFGSTGIYVASLLSGLADVDAITLTMANLALAGDITAKIAITAITIAAVTNTVVKGGIAYFVGGRKFALWVIGSFAIAIVLGLLSLILL